MALFFKQAGDHPLELSAKYRAVDNAGAPKTQADASWENIPSDQRAAKKANVDVYLDDFISVVRGGPSERRQMLRHIFHQIDTVFRPNEEADTNHK